MYGVLILYCLYGLVGQCQDLGCIFKGKKMVGYMGVVCVIIQNFQVVCIDEDCGLIMVKGVVFGLKGGWVIIKDVVKKVVFENLVLFVVLKLDVVLVEVVVEGGENNEG